MGRWLSRRRVFALAAAALSTALPGRSWAGEETTQEQCSWRRMQGPLCSGGTKKEYWCERCCDPYGCVTIRCEWRVVGNC